MNAASESNPSQFDIDRTYPGLWTITFSDPPINMFVPGTIVELGTLVADLESDRSVEIVLSGDDFDADIAERYGLVNRTLEDNGLDSFVDALVRRLASFDREALGAVKAQVNRFGTPTATELKSSTDIFFSALGWPGQQRCRARIRTMSYGVRRDFELNVGRDLPALE